MLTNSELKQPTPDEVYERKIKAHQELYELDWQELLETGLSFLLASKPIASTTAAEHFERTPQRVSKALLEMMQGCFHDPVTTLGTVFTAPSQEMVALYEMDFVSLCAHHLLPFYGKAHFAYVPDKQIVGLSKIPRLLKVLSCRPQIQEELSKQMVDTFMEVVRPLGCSVIMDAVHTCMLVRGVKQYANTRTSAVRGLFLENQQVQAEFLAGVQRAR